MPKAPDFDLADAHRRFAPYCFNSAWNLIEKAERTEEEPRLMVALSFASLYHWMQRPDCTDRNLSIGYWQASRVQALTGNAPEAARLGEICLSYSQQLPPFFLAYAHEAVARGQMMLGDDEAAQAHIAAARELLPLVREAKDREMIDADLRDIG